MGGGSCGPLLFVIPDEACTFRQEPSISMYTRPRCSHRDVRRDRQTSVANNPFAQPLPRPLTYCCPAVSHPPPSAKKQIDLASRAQPGVLPLQLACDCGEVSVCGWHRDCRQTTRACQIKKMYFIRRLRGRFERRWQRIGAL